MDTPLGNRYGTLEVSALIGDVTGSLNILGKCNPLTGNIGADGSCSLRGEFVTLLKAYRYIADGIITEDHVKLGLATDRAVYNVLGTSSKASS